MSSAVKFQTSYKLFEPDYLPQTPIILGVDNRLESPETTTLRYEEAARGIRNGGSSSGQSPSMEMATYTKTQLPSLSGYEAAQYPDANYDQYQPQTFPNSQSERYAQLNQQAFASNNGVGQYVPTRVVEMQPSSGLFGTKILFKFTSTMDFFSMTSPTMPYVSVLFGSQKCAAQEVTRESQDSNGSLVYSCWVEAPQLLVTGCSSSNVPLSLVLEGPSGEDISRTVAGTFQYLDGSSVGGEDEDITRADKVRKHAADALSNPQVGPAASSTSTTSNSAVTHHNSNTPSQGPVPVDQPGTSPKLQVGDGQHVASHHHHHHQAAAAATNTYDYPAAAANAAAAAAAVHPAQYGNAFTTSPINNDMITTYRSSNFTDPGGYSRRVGSAWHGGYGGSTLGSNTSASGRSSLDHSGLGRHGMSLTTTGGVGGNGSGAPQLVRTSTISNGPSSSSGYHPMSLYSSKAVLKINGRLDSMAQDWTAEEWDNKRRLVLFRKNQTGSTLNASFKPVSPSERPPGSVCISCIWWAEKNECFVTSVDTIYLLEQLVAAPAKFSVEEKNRIRRNLEGFHPLTVSKAKADSEEFFKIIMGFPNPKPRNIEKDVKVFPWKILEQSLKKIIGKYSASPSSCNSSAGGLGGGHSSGSLMSSISAASAAGGYAALPTPPGHHGLPSHNHHHQQGLPSQHHHHADPYSQSGGHVHPSGHDGIPSPRSLSGSGPSWTPYTAATNYSSTSRTLSPASQSHLRTHTHTPHPQQTPQHQTGPPQMRINTGSLPPSNSYDTRTVSAGGYGSSSLHTPISHHPSTATPPRWDAGASSGYNDGYSQLNGHHHSTHPVYSTGAYADGASRA